jgi:hypothetical protein
VELLATLVGAGVGVGVAVDGLEHPFGVLDDLLYALPLPRGCAVAARLLLLLLMELLCKLLDFLAPLHVVAPRVVYQAPWTTLITTGGLPRPLVTT